MAFLPFTKKKILGNPYLKICDLTQYFFEDTPIKKKIKNSVLPPLTALLGHPVQNIFFPLIKKIFLQCIYIYVYIYRQANGIYIYMSQKVAIFQCAIVLIRRSRRYFFLCAVPAVIIIIISFCAIG